MKFPQTEKLSGSLKEYVFELFLFLFCDLTLKWLPNSHFKKILLVMTDVSTSKQRFQYQQIIIKSSEKKTLSIFALRVHYFTRTKKNRASKSFLDVIYEEKVFSTIFLNSLFLLLGVIFSSCAHRYVFSRSNFFQKQSWIVFIFFEKNLKQ